MPRIPMPSPRGTNYAQKFLPADFYGKMAMDQMPSNAFEAGRIAGTSPAPRKMDRVNGDQTDDPDVTVVTSEVEATLLKLMQLIKANMSINAAASAEELIGQLFGLTAPKDANGNSTSSVAQDAAYRRRFPDEGRLRPTPTLRASSKPMTYEERFGPNARRLVKRIF